MWEGWIWRGGIGGRCRSLDSILDQKRGRRRRKKTTMGVTTRRKKTKPRSAGGGGAGGIRIGACLRWREEKEALSVRKVQR